VSGTPTVFIDGEKLGNEAFQDALDEAIKANK
jgi:protein-disulfide isomerase